MKYFFISDVHAHFEAMKKSLDAHGFNEYEDTLVSVGDLQDRGTEFLECLDYVMSLPHHIIICGNHEMEFYRKLTKQKKWDYYDVANGVKSTFYSLMENKVSKGSLSHLAWEFNYCKDFAGARAKYVKYFNEGHMAIEFKDLIVTHSWVPNMWNNAFPVDWRSVKSFESWYHAAWSNCCYNIKAGYFPDKQIVVGHIDARKIAEVCLESGLISLNDYARFKTEESSAFVCSKMVALDGAVAEGGEVRVYVYETDESPILYDVL